MWRIRARRAAAAVWAATWCDGSTGVWLRRGSVRGSSSSSGRHTSSIMHSETSASRCCLPSTRTRRLADSASCSLVHCHVNIHATFALAAEDWILQNRTNVIFARHCFRNKRRAAPFLSMRLQTRCVSGGVCSTFGSDPSLLFSLDASTTRCCLSSSRTAPTSPSRC